MTTEKTFVVGVCTRLRDSSAFIEVRAQSIDGVLHDCSQTSQRDFPPDGEVELRAARSILKVNDWALARPVPEGPPRRQRLVSSWTRRLTPFDDISELYAPEAARRLLVETGLQDGFIGEKVFRIGPSEVVAVNMIKSPDGRCRATATDLGRLPVLRFDSAKVHVVPTPNGSVTLVERGPDVIETGFVNWATDAEYIEQIVRAAVQQESEAARSQAALAALLLSNADRLGARLSGAQNPDPKVASEILRSRRLGELLTANSEVVSQFMTALRRDPEIARRIDQEIAAIAAAVVAEQRDALTAELTKTTEAEFAKMRQAKTAELETFFRDLDASMLQELEAKMKQREAEALSNLEVRRLGLEKAVSSMEHRRDELNEGWTSRMQEVEVLSAEAAKLTSEIVDRKADVDRLLRMQQLVDSAGAKSAHQNAPSGFRLPVASATSKPMAISEVAAWIKSCPLLSPPGKAEFARLIALVLSGAVPVVSGPDADDVVATMAMLLSGGALVEFECDPTVITLEDLWTRPGGQVQTILGIATAEAASGRTMFCTVRRPELTPSQYWVGGLRRAMKDTYLPPGLLLCLVVTDDQAAGAEALLTEWSAVRADGWIDRAAAMRSLSLTGPKAIDHVVDPASLVVDTAGATGAIALAQSTRVTMADAKWIARLMAATKAVVAENPDSFVKEVIERAFNDAAKPELKVVDSRGPSHA